MENKDIFVVVLAIIGGVFSILASAFNWDFFFENRKAKFFMTIFGRQGSRIFYTILGLGLLFVAYKLLTK